MRPELSAESHPRGPDLLRRPGTYIPADGGIRAQGGTEDELLRPLDVAP